MGCGGGGSRVACVFGRVNVRVWLGVGGSEYGEESDSHSAETSSHTYHHHPCVLVRVVVGSVRAASEPASCLSPRCRHPAAATLTATMWSTMWSASMPSPCLTVPCDGHDGMKWDAAVVAGVWRAYSGG